ncbi:MAG TPA: beta-ketoacyl-[acyl-carrier-protein] synthase II [Desulfarculaceae bacterium]|nr:beta-ketoacyl-[acyl-carrier-protein] synthase II [Desulfarculaceae bacterium]
MKRRVVITGVGMVTPLGTGVEKNWSNLLAGKSGISPITSFDTEEFATKIAGQVTDFEATNFIDAKDIKKMDTFIHFAIAAADMAMTMAKLEVTPSLSPRLGVSVGAGLGGLPCLEHYHKILLEKGPRRVSPFLIPMMIANLAPGNIAIRHQAKGPNISTVTACASGTHAIGEGMKIIQRDDSDVMICGGTESAITPLGVAGFNAMKALSTSNDEPTKASRPFDRDRDGFVPAEGAGVLILEELEFALKRGAPILAELTGYGSSCDAFHIASPAPGGVGAAASMEMALRDAGFRPEEIDYINAHGTSTYFNDLYETQAIKKVFGEYAKKLLISSSKSMTGHMLGGTGAVEAIYSILAIRDGKVPPTINLDNPDPECDLNYVPNKAVEAPVKKVVSNSFGFGGTNATLAFSAY